LFIDSYVIFEGRGPSFTLLAFTTGFGSLLRDKGLFEALAGDDTWAERGLWTWDFADNTVRSGMAGGNLLGLPLVSELLLVCLSIVFSFLSVNKVVCV
jgi:hypothetical protein